MAAPKILQAIFAAFGDYYTWKIAQATYGRKSIESRVALYLTVVSPWQWFCSTRTFSNCIETTLTVIALYNWPWHWTIVDDALDENQLDQHGLRIRDAGKSTAGEVDETTRIRRALLAAASATILRPTNVLIWIALTLLTFVRSVTLDRLIRIPRTDHTALLHFSGWSLAPGPRECITFLREAIFCGSVVLILSAIIDRIFYQAWVFPPLNFLYFNVVQSLAIFYGNNDWHYYLSQGFPLLLTTALPFTLISLYRVIAGTKTSLQLDLTSHTVLFNLAITCLFVPATLSIIAHKEVRFIYPLLPALHVITAVQLSSFFKPIFDQNKTTTSRSTKSTGKRLVLTFLLVLNIIICLYTSLIHNSGLVGLTKYLRNEFESQYLGSSPSTNMTVGMLMPCHSTPWRSHIQYPPSGSRAGIDAWALTCEPPLHLNTTEKQIYLDEADLFYEDPSLWLKSNMVRTHPRYRHNTHESTISKNKSLRREWPDYLIFFAQLEPTLQSSLRGSGYMECRRLFNSHWHDDWRREGDIVVWCLDERRHIQYMKSKTQAFSRQDQSFVSDFGARTIKDPVTSKIGSLPVPETLGQKILGHAGSSINVKDKLEDVLSIVENVRAATGAAFHQQSVLEKARWKSKLEFINPARWRHNIPGFGMRKKQGSWWKGRDNLWN